ncbi:MAG TPA: hypothetical protein VHP99_20335 [Pyrinomonadaceae bacterium]|jgi:hypothetical protein|nr:hypothetical protein [Pyrinomonadaceae bacterium]
MLNQTAIGAQPPAALAEWQLINRVEVKDLGRIKISARVFEIRIGIVDQRIEARLARARGVELDLRPAVGEIL